jgi:hypothetical protein
MDIRNYGPRGIVTSRSTPHVTFLLRQFGEWVALSLQIHTASRSRQLFVGCHYFGMQINGAPELGMASSHYAT